MDASTEDVRIGTDGSARIRVTVTNEGRRAGWHVAQLYLSDPVASVTRPVRRLIGFARTFLEPAATAAFTFEVHADLTLFTGLAGHRVVEPGLVVLTVADDAAAAGIPLEVVLDGPVRQLDRARHMTVPVIVD